MSRQDFARVSAKNEELEGREQKWKDDLEKYEGEFRKISRRNEELEEDNGRGNSVYENLRSELRMLFDENESLREEKDNYIKRCSELERKYNLKNIYTISTIY